MAKEEIPPLQTQDTKGEESEKELMGGRDAFSYDQGWRDCEENFPSLRERLVSQGVKERKSITVCQMQIPSSPCLPVPTRNLWSILPVHSM